MKRICILVLLAMVVTMTSVANSFIPEKEVKAAEIKISSAKPVRDPYLHMDAEDWAQFRKEKKYANRLVKRDLPGAAETEPATGDAEQVSDVDSGLTGSSERLQEGGAGDGDEGVSGDGSEGDFCESDSAIDPTWNEIEGSTGSSAADDGRSVYLGEWTITAYCACPICCGEWSTGCTASGVLATANHTLACNTLPFGTQVLIGDIVYTVEDTGWSPYGDAWADIFFDSHDEALAFGVRTMEVYLVG